MIIPTKFGAPWFIETIELDGTFYDLEFRINRRDNRWRMSVSTGGVLLCAGVPLLTRRDVLLPMRSDARMPQGQMIVVDTKDLDRDATETGLGTEFLLTYAPL